MKAFWKNKTVFITGATGFIGSWLTMRLLELEANVMILVFEDDLESPVLEIEERENFTKVKGDIKDFSLLKNIFHACDIDVVFHLAAMTQVIDALNNPFLNYETNIKGTYNLLEAIRLSEKEYDAVVLASSDKAYGQQAEFPFQEQMPLHPTFPYDVSKACLEMIALSYFKTYKLPIVITRSANVYGGGDFNWNRLIPSVIKNCYFDEKIILRSTGKNIRDYIFVEDVLQGYLKLAASLHEQNLYGEIFNLSSHSPLTALEVAEKIKNKMGKDELEIVVLNQGKYEIEHQILSGEKAERLIDYKALFPFDLGLDLTIEWYQMYFEQKKQQSYASTYYRS